MKCERKYAIYEKRIKKEEKKMFKENKHEYMKYVHK